MLKILKNQSGINSRTNHNKQLHDFHENTYFQEGVAQSKKATTPLTFCPQVSHQKFQIRYYTFLYLKGLQSKTPRPNGVFEKTL